jgi:hypothetical protein
MMLNIFFLQLRHYNLYHIKIDHFIFTIPDSSQYNMLQISNATFELSSAVPICVRELR